MGDSGKLLVSILSAGWGSRMGVPKCLLPIGGKPAIVSLLDRWREADLKEIIVISGAYHTLVKRRLGDMPILYNPNYGEGMASSIRVAVDFALVGDYEALIILLADQPLVTVEMLRRLVETFHRGFDAVAFKVGSSPTPPAIFRGKAFKRLSGLRGDIGARKILADMRNKRLIEGYEPFLRDFDTLWEYMEVRGALSAPAE